MSTRTNKINRSKYMLGRQLKCKIKSLHGYILLAILYKETQNMHQGGLLKCKMHARNSRKIKEKENKVGFR